MLYIARFQVLCPVAMSICPGFTMARSSVVLHVRYMSYIDALLHLHYTMFSFVFVVAIYMYLRISLLFQVLKWIKAKS